MTVTGADVNHARDVVRAMALSWCADCDLSLVTVCPIGIDIDAAAQLNRFEPLSAVAALNLARADREPFDVPFGTNRGDVIADEFRVFIIDATHPAATELVALCQPTLAFAVIAIGDMPGVGARLQLTGTGRARLEPLGLDVDTTPVTRETAAALSMLLDPETPLVPEPVLADLFGELLDQADTIAEGHLFNPGPPHPTPADDPPVSVVTAPAVEGAVLATRHEHAHDHDTAAGVDDDGAGDGGAGLVDEHGVAIVGFDDTDDSDRRLDAGPLTLLPQWQHRLRVLGPVRVDGIDSLSGPARSIVAYLAMARFEQTDTERRVRPDILADRVWGGRLRSKDTLSNAITAIRRALPLDSDQPAILRRGRGDDAVDSLNPAIGTDLEQLAAAISVAPTLSSSDAIEVLTHVLALVEGFPFQGRYLDWAEEAHSMWAYKAVAFVEEAAVQLITLAIDTRDPHLVETALAAGGRGCPNSERLLKARMMYAMSQGSLTGFVTAWKTALAEHDAELSPDLTTWVDTQRARLTHK